MLTAVAMMAGISGAVAAPTSPPTSTTPSAVKALAAGWLAYRDRFIATDGRVIDDANKISHSEGQAYAMLLAERLDDREAFQRIWRWTEANLRVRDDGLVAWKWDAAAVPPGVTDRNNASDGDLMIAWSLARAAKRWQEPTYAAAATSLLTSLLDQTTRRTPAGLIMLPGVDGFGPGDQPDGPVINLSYWVFPALDELKQLLPDRRLDELRETGLRILRASGFGPLRLPSDWVALGSGKPEPAQGFPARFSYNAIRIPLYLAWAGLRDGNVMRRFTGLVNVEADLGPFEIDVESGAAAAPMKGAGYRAVIALAACAAEGRRPKLPLQALSPDLYYPTTLHLLALSVAIERYPQCL